jgi:4,5-DOPA dioxygenase extradiol
LSSLDPEEHVAVGKALRELSENILAIGSGFSFHSMRAFSWQGGELPDTSNDAFQNWLIDTSCSSHSNQERQKRLIDWELAPFARYCHPREEHLLPIHVCAGMADKPAKLIFKDHILGKRGIAFLWD